MGRGAWAWCCYNRCLPIRAGRGGHVLPPATRLATAAVAPSCWHWRKGNAGGSGRASVRAAITGVGTKGGAWGVGGTKRYDTAQPTRDQGGKRSVLPLRLFTLPGQLGEVRGASLRRPRHHRVDSKRIMLVLFFLPRTRSHVDPTPLHIKTTEIFLRAFKWEKNQGFKNI